MFLVGSMHCFLHLPPSRNSKGMELHLVSHKLCPVDPTSNPRVGLYSFKSLKSLSWDLTWVRFHLKLPWLSGKPLYPIPQSARWLPSGDQNWLEVHVAWGKPRTISREDFPANHVWQLEDMSQLYRCMYQQTNKQVVRK